MTKSKELPSTERLHELFRYDAETGNLIRKVKTARCTKIGEVAGSTNKLGYRIIKIDGRDYKAHRIIWKMHFGDIHEDKFIDHVNGDPSDNRLRNLRLAFNGENQRNRAAPSNNTSGFKGVSFHRTANKFIARIRHNGKLMHLGYFATPESAHASYCEAVKRYHREFARVA